MISHNCILTDVTSHDTVFEMYSPSTYTKYVGLCFLMILHHTDGRVKDLSFLKYKYWQ